MSQRCGDCKWFSGLREFADDWPGECTFGPVPEAAYMKIVTPLDGTECEVWEERPNDDERT